MYCNILARECVLCKVFYTCGKVWIYSLVSSKLDHQIRSSSQDNRQGCWPIGVEKRTAAVAVVMVTQGDVVVLSNRSAWVGEGQIARVNECSSQMRGTITEC